MVTPNTNHSGEGFEVNENSTPKQENLYQKLLRSYAKKKLDSKSDRLGFVKKIKSAVNIPADILAEIEAHKSSVSEFSGLNITPDTITLGSLQVEIGSYLTQLQSKKTSLRTTFLQEYDISPQDYTKYISSAVDDINTEDTLIKLQDSAILRDEFLAGIYKKKIPKRRLVSYILKDLNIESRFETLPGHLKQGFMDTVSKFQKREQLETADIMVLFEANILTTSEKQKIIETFMPSISVQDAMILGIIDTKGANSIKKQALENALDTGMFSGVNLESYISNIQDSELIISTGGLFSTSKTQEMLFEQNFFFKKFKTDYASMLQKIEKDLADKSIQTPKEMKEILSGVSHIQGLDAFKEGGIIIIQQQQKDASGTPKDVTLYAEILSLASAGTFIIKERGVNTYNTSLNKTSRQTYSQFIDYATKGNIPNAIEFISPETLSHRIENTEIIDVHGNKIFKNREHISEDMKSITERIEAKEKELTKQGLSKEERHKNEDLQRLYRERNEKNNLRDNLESSNKQTLLAKINEFDAKGKDFGFESGVTFVTQAGPDSVFTVQSVDELNQSVTILGFKGEETLSYVDFMNAFEHGKAERVSKIKDFSELFNQQGDAYKSWTGFELKNGKVINKNTKADISYNYLVPSASSSNQELIKIHSIDGAKATISFGEAKSKNKKGKDGKDKQIGEIFSTERQEYTVDIGVLDHYIRKNKLDFRSLEEGKVVEEQTKGIPKPKETFGVFNFLFQGMSIASAIKGSKTAIEQITNSLKEGDDDKANQFALKVFGPLLGKDGKTDMQSRIEQTQKKSMEDFTQRLKDINSTPATLQIERWLLDPRTPEYKKEAGMFYMFEKYGALNAKVMYKYQGQYFWYQKMGGRIGDSVWVETHEKNNRDPKQNTTEEQLIYNLMSEQVKEGGYNGIKRRSKLAKELKAMRGKGKQEEYETGVKDGSNERSVQDRLDGGLSELSSGNYPNAWGWQETIENKGGSMKQMNMIPFVSMFSGMAYNFEKDMVDKFKNGAGDSRLLMMKSFISYPQDIDLVNNTIMEACKILDKDSKYAGILSQAQKIFSKQKDQSSEKEKQVATIAFYEKYGEVLTNILYMLNTGDVDDVHHKMIFFEKDNNSTFKQYYDKLGAISGSADTSFSKNEGLMADAFDGKGTSGINMYKATKELLEKGNEGTWRKHDAGPLMWKEIVHEFEAIAKRKYHKDPIENIKMQKKLLEYNLRSFLSAIMGSYSSGRAVESFNSPTGSHTKLNDWGIYFDELSNVGANAESIKGKGNQQIIDRFVQQILNVENGSSSLAKPTMNDGKGGYIYTHEKNSTDYTISVSDAIQGKTQDIMKTPTPANLTQRPNEDEEERAA